MVCRRPAVRISRRRLPLLQRGPDGDVPPHCGGQSQVPLPLQRGGCGAEPACLLELHTATDSCPPCIRPTDRPNRRDRQDLQDLLRRLLVRRPALRLGVQAGGAEDIKRHPWFGGFDWAAFEARSLPAPYVPKVGGSNRGGLRLFRRLGMHGVLTPTTRHPSLPSRCPTPVTPPTSSPRSMTRPRGAPTATSPTKRPGSFPASDWVLPRWVVGWWWRGGSLKVCVCMWGEKDNKPSRVTECGPVGLELCGFM